MFFFFFNDTATTEIYTLSLHDALPISARDPGVAPARARRAGGRARPVGRSRPGALGSAAHPSRSRRVGDRKSTRLNSSHSQISYAVFCLKKKKKAESQTNHPLISTRPI